MGYPRQYHSRISADSFISRTSSRLRKNNRSSNVSAALSSRTSKCGVVARRRVAFFGRSYEGAGRAALPMTPFLLDLRTKAAGWIQRDPAAFVMALINEYSPDRSVRQRK
jgi:hypothetical protein